MRNVAKYLERAGEFDKLTNEVADPVLKRRYADIAECYRLLADDLRRLIATGVLESSSINHQEAARPGPSGFVDPVEARD